MLRILSKVFILLSTSAFIACNGGLGVTSSTTGWPYDFKAENAFNKSSSVSSNVPLGMVEIPGWSYAIDDVEAYETVSRRTKPGELNTRRTIAVNSFYMDQQEVRNIDWREYQAWLTAVYSKVDPERIERAKPDVKAWTADLGENEPFMMNYFTHPSFNEYPVVCITWEQAVDYCEWRTDRANELQLVKAKIIKAPDFKAIAEMETLAEVENAVFSSKRYFNSLQDNLAASYKGMFYDFRLPTEDEWEFAAYARKATDGENSIKMYPWTKNAFGKLSKLQKEQLKAHYNQANSPNNSVNVFSRTLPVSSFAPNDLGLYNMAGNVNEWVYDQYSKRGNLNKIDSVDILDVFLPDFHKHDDSRVYKGGSWKDPAYWLHPTTRRSLDRKSSANDIGFRCAMSFIPRPTTVK